MKITITTSFMFSTLAFSACTPIEPSGDLFSPVAVANSAPEEVVATPTDTEETVDTPAPTVVPSTTTAEDEALFGPEPQVQEQPEEQPLETPTDTEVAETPVVTAPPVTSWGIRLVSTINDTTPPRAVLALTTGEEIVVRAGQMLPDAQMVILAIGQDVVQVANITADGDRALVESMTLNAFSPSRDTRE